MNQHPHQPTDPDESPRGSDRLTLESQLDQLAAFERSAAPDALENRVFTTSHALLHQERRSDRTRPSGGETARWRVGRLAQAAALTLVVFGAGAALWNARSTRTNQADADAVASFENDLDDWLDTATDEPSATATPATELTELTELTQEIDQLQRRLADPWGAPAAFDLDEDSL